MASRTVHGFRLNDSAKAALCSMEDSFENSKDSAKDVMSSAELELSSVNNQVDELYIPARKLLGEEPTVFFGLPEIDADFEKELEKAGIFILKGIPLLEGTENNLSSMRSLAKLTSYAKLQSFLGKDPGSFTYIAFSGNKNLGQDVSIGSGGGISLDLVLGTPPPKSKNIYLDFFWLEFANPTYANIKKMGQKGFSESQTSKTIAEAFDIPTSIVGSGQGSMNVTTIQDSSLLDRIEDTLGLPSSATSELITDRRMNSVDITKSSTDALKSIQNMLLNSVGVTEDSTYTLYFTPEMMILGTLDPLEFNPSAAAEAIADELSELNLEDKEESDTALIFGVVETAWDAIGQVLKEYRKTLVDEFNETAIFLSWYMNTVGFGDYNKSPLPTTLGSASNSPMTDGRIDDLLLDDARDDCKIDVLGVAFDDGLRKTSRALSVSRGILSETSIILNNAPDTLRPEVLEFAQEWKGNLDLILFLYDSALISIGQMRVAVNQVFPRLWDTFTDSRENATSDSTANILDSLG